MTDYDPKENAVRFLVAMLQNPNTAVSMAGWDSMGGNAILDLARQAARLADELDKSLTEKGLTES